MDEAAQSCVGVSAATGEQRDTATCSSASHSGDTCECDAEEQDEESLSAAPQTGPVSPV